jgi:hypothetical protein
VVRTHEKPKGFIAIVTLLIVAGVAMAFAISMLMDGLGNATLSVSSIKYENARINAMTCVEDALLRIRKEETFLRDLDYSIGPDSGCETEIQWFEENPVAPGVTERLVNLDVTGTSNEFERSFRYELRVKKFVVNHTDGTQQAMNAIEFISITETT